MPAGTPMGTSLDDKVLKPLLLKPAKSLIKKLKKPLLVIVITDGAPFGEKGVKNNRDKLPQVVRHTAAEMAKTKCAWLYIAIADDDRRRKCRRVPVCPGRRRREGYVSHPSSANASPRVPVLARRGPRDRRIH